MMPLAFVRAGEFEEHCADDPDAVLAEALAAARRAVALSLNPNHVNIIMTSSWVSVVNCDPERAIE